MAIEKTVPGRAQKLADIKARYEELLAKEEEKGRRTETGMIYESYINDVFEALDNPSEVKFSLIVNMFAEDNNKDKKVIATSIRTWLKSKASPYTTRLDGKSLWVERK